MRLVILAQPSARIAARGARRLGIGTAALATALTTALVTLAGCRGASEAKSASAPAAATTTPSAAAGGETVPATSVPATGAKVAMPADSLALRNAADLGRIDGAPTAKVWMIEASDFQCPYCKVWHDQSFETLHKEYVATGKVRVAYLNFPLGQHAQAMPAAEAAMCASAQGHFWPYHTGLFASQAQWEQQSDPSSTFDSLATANGLDLPRFRSCRASHVMRALIAADQDRMETRGVQSTPSFFVGNQAIAGALPIEQFRKALDGALAQAR